MKKENQENQEKLYVRKYSFPFIPFGFFARLIAKLAYFKELKMEKLWRNGIYLKNERNERSILNCSEGICEGDQNEENFEYFLKITVFSNKLQSKEKILLIQQLSQIIESLLSSYYYKKDLTCKFFF